MNGNIILTRIFWKVQRSLLFLRPSILLWIMQKLTLVILALLANCLAFVGGILPIVLRRSLNTNNLTKKIRADFHIRKPLKNFLSTLEIFSLSSKQQFYHLLQSKTLWRMSPSWCPWFSARLFLWLLLLPAPPLTAPGGRQQQSYFEYHCCLPP